MLYSHRHFINNFSISILHGTNSEIWISVSTCSVDTGEGCHSVFFVVLLNTESIHYSVFCLPKAVQMDSCCCICALNLKPKSCLNLHVLMNVLYGDLVENILVTRTKNLKWLSFSWQACWWSVSVVTWIYQPVPLYCESKNLTLQFVCSLKYSFFYRLNFNTSQFLSVVPS